MRLALALFICGLSVRAAPPDETARSLARKIIAALGSREAAALTVRNASSLSETEVAAVRAVLESELRGIVQNSDAANKIIVTLSENVAGCVWIGEVIRGDKRNVVMVSRPRTAAADVGTNLRAPMILEKKLLFEQTEPILDAVETGSGLLVLSLSAATMYTRQNEQWKAAQSFPVPSPTPVPRDVRGRLEVAGDSFHAYLPGVICLGKVQPEFLMDCEAGDGRWPLGAGNAMFAKGRNFIEARFAKDLPPFFSAAQVMDRDSASWIFTGLDGRARLYDQALQPTGAFDGWGSDIAAVQSQCGSGRQVLVDRSTDSNEPDAIQAYEIVDRRAVAVTAPLEFLGPITSLWTAGNEETAVAISRDVSTGRYAAFSLAISCAN